MIKFTDWLRNKHFQFVANTIKNTTNYKNLNNIHSLINGSQIINDNILLYKGQWILFKN